jgi:hypothetical protein
LPAADGEKLLQSLRDKGIQEASLIGEVTHREKDLISVEY